MDAPVRGEFGVEGCGKQLPLPDGDDPTGALVSSQNADARADPLHPGRADEHRPERVTGYPGQGDVVLERVDLAAERVPADGHVDAAVGLLPATPSASRSASMIIPAQDPKAGSPSPMSLR